MPARLLAACGSEDARERWPWASTVFGRSKIIVKNPHALIKLFSCFQHNRFLPQKQGIPAPRDMPAQRRISPLTILVLTASSLFY